MKQRVLGFVVLILALAMGTTAPRTQSRVEVPQRVSERAAAGGFVPVIVGVNAAFTPEGYLADSDAVFSQRATIAVVRDDVMTRAADAGVAIGTDLGVLPFFTARVDRAGLEALAALPGVVSIEENGEDRADLATSIPIVNAIPAWTAGFTGSGWTVAVLDTGVQYTHPFLSGKLVAEGCYSNGSGTGTSVCPGGANGTGAGSGRECSAAIDGCDHGTHVAGTAVGTNGQGGINGVARGSTLAAFQVFTRRDDTAVCGGASFTPCVTSAQSDQVLALNRVAALAGPGNVNRIASVNMSLGGSRFFDQATCDAANAGNGRRTAIQNLRSLGIAVVASSGNDGFLDSMGAPGCISEVVSVGSILDTLNVSSFSNNAPFLSLYAPGSSIESSIPTNSYAFFNGTSMAAPHVAGAWAILKQAVPGATVAAVLSALQTTGTIINDQRGAATPHPLINVEAARTALLGGGGGGAPGAPTSFAVNVNGNALSMTWGVPASGGAPTNYNLIARVASGGAPVVVLPLGNVTSFAINAPNGGFFLSVQASNASGAGPESNVVPVTVPTLPPPPGLPSGLVATVTGNSATLNWTAPATGGPVANYVLVAGQTPGFATPLATLVLGPATGAVINGIPPGTWYVRIYAANAGGNSPGTTNEVALVVAGPQPPGTPTMNTPTVSAGNTVNLSWSPGAGGTPSSYNLIVRGSAAGPVIAQFALSATAVSFGGVPSGTYFLQVIANNALGSSGLSNQVTLVVP